MTSTFKEVRYGDALGELDYLDRWVVWEKGKVKDSKWNKFEKIPRYPKTHGYVKSYSDTSGCSNYETAIAEYEKSKKYEGIGLFLTSEDPHCLIDIDRCLDPQTGELKPWARELVSWFNSFTYKTPSGTGLRIVIKGSLDRNYGKATWYFDGEAHEVELYDHDYWLTFPHDSEDLYTYDEIRDAQDDLNEFIATLHQNTSQNTSTGTSECQERQATEVGGILLNGEEPPVRLSKSELRVWNGEAHKTKDDGEIDRSESLYWIGSILYENGASVSAVTTALKERDIKLGWDTYTARTAKNLYLTTALNIEKKQKGKQKAASSTNYLGERTQLGPYMSGEVQKPHFLVENIVPEGRSVHVFGPSESGKSWFALWLSAEVMRKGGKVLYLDKESTPLLVGGRLKALKVEPEVVGRLFDFRNDASTPVSNDAKKDFASALDEIQPQLIVFDSWVRFLESADLDENDAGGISSWSSAYLDPAKKRGFSVVVLDHVAKSGNANTARGSGRKKEEFDAQFEFKKSKNFTTHSAGEIQLITTKDRESILPIRTTFSVGANEEDSFVFDLKSVDTAGEKKPTWKLSFHDLPPKEQAAIEVLRTFGTQGARDKDWIGAGGGNTSKSTIDRVKKRFKQGELAKNVLGYNEKASKYFTSVKPQTAQSRITSGTIGAFDNLVSLEDFLVSEPDVAS